MPVLSVIKVFKIFRTFLLKILTFTLPFFENSTVLLIYNVGVFFFLLFEVAILSRVFLFFLTKVIIQTTGHIN
jgi:hypothetical protein